MNEEIARRIRLVADGVDQLFKNDEGRYSMGNICIASDLRELADALDKEPEVKLTEAERVAAARLSALRYELHYVAPDKAETVRQILRVFDGDVDWQVPIMRFNRRYSELAAISEGEKE